MSYLGRGEPPPSLPLVKALARGESGRAPLLCIQALQEQRTDIRPKNTQLQPHQLAVETMRASHCSSFLLELWWPPHADSVFRKVCSRVCVLGYLLFFHHQPCNLQPFETFERNLPSQHLPQHLPTEQTVLFQTGFSLMCLAIAPKTFRLRLFDVSLLNSV